MKSACLRANFFLIRIASTSNAKSSRTCAATFHGLAQTLRNVSRHITIKTKTVRVLAALGIGTKYR